MVIKMQRIVGYNKQRIIKNIIIFGIIDNEKVQILIRREELIS